MDWISRLQGTSPSHFNTRKIDNFVYFSYISKCRRSYIKDCGRIAQRHECPIIRVKGCMCWSSFVDSFLNQTKSSKTIVTCYVRTMLNLDLLRDVNRCSVEQTSFDRAWAPTSGRFEGLCDFFCGGLATMFPKHNAGRDGFLPRRNHTCKSYTNVSAHVGLITCWLPPYNTTIPYIYCTFAWHPWFPYINRRLRPYIKPKKVI